MRNAIIVLFLFLLSCAPSTRYYFYNENYLKYSFNNQSIAVCPYTGEWRLNRTDSAHYRIPGIEQYPIIIAKEIEIKRKCLNVIYPDKVQALIPDIELMVFRHKMAFQKMTPIDSLGFQLIADRTQADFLIFIEWISFSAYNDYSMNTVQTQKKTTILYQLWDLNKRCLISRAESDGTGMDVANLMKNLSSQEAIESLADEIAKELPNCQKR